MTELTSSYNAADYQEARGLNFTFVSFGKLKNNMTAETTVMSWAL